MPEGRRPVPPCRGDLLPSRRVLTKKRDDRVGDELGLLEEDHMPSVGNVRHMDAGADALTKGVAVLGRGDAIVQALHDKEWYLAWWLDPVGPGVARSAARWAAATTGQR